MDNEKTKGLPNVKTDTSVSAGSGDSSAAASELSPTAPDHAGKVMGGYQLVRMIAEGGMGVVYEAIQLNLSRQVAVKILSDELAARPEFVHRFQREAKAAAALNHPNMVQVHDFCQADDRCYLVMEYVEGQDLAQYAEENGKIPIEAALEIAEQAALALKAASEKSIIHRDIKPSNLMLTRDGKIKVSDLGLAKILNEASDLTLTGAGMGSPYFMAPEQASDARDVDHRVDIYSLGITLLYLMTGKRPFDGNTPFSIVLAHANKPLPSGVELGTELPEEVEALIQKMAAKNPLERYADYDALLTDLRRVKAGYAPGVAPAAARRNYISARAIVSSTVLASLFVIAAFFLSRSKPAVMGRERSVPPAPVIQVSEAPAPIRTPPMDRERSRRPAELAERPLPPEDMQGPGDRDFPEPRDRGGNSVASLLGRLPRPDLASLQDGPVSTMLAQTDSYATAHPQNFRDMVDRYRQVLTKARGTPQEGQVNEKLQNVIEQHQAALRKTLHEYERRMDEKVRAHQPQAAYDVWKSFPQSLRTFESDEQISEILQRNLPPGFVPK